MSTIGSSLSKGQDGTALINPAALGQLGGIAKDLLRSAFDAAVTQERLNITNNGAGIWNNGEKVSIFGEVGTRIWFVGASASLSHARNVSYQGKTYTLAADANVFGLTSGAPSSGTGANGDIMVDRAAGLLYGPKASGAWPAGVSLGGSTTITPVLIDGSAIAASTGSPYQMLATSELVDVNKTTGAATSITWPSSPTIGKLYTIVDGKLDAATNNVTIAFPAGVTGVVTGWKAADNTIGPAATVVFYSNGDAITVRFINATTARVV